MRRERNVLIIEDNPGDVRLMREALRELRPPALIHVAESGEDALRYLQHEGERRETPWPDLIFLDFNLPRSDARDLLRQIKNHHVTRLIPVAVLTSSDSEHDVRTAYELHANCYLRKPVDLDSFLHTIRAAAHFWLEVAQTAESPELGPGQRTRLL